MVLWSSVADKGALQRVVPKQLLAALFCLLRNSLPPDASTGPTLSPETPPIHLTTCLTCCPLADASNQLRHQIDKELLSLSHMCNKQKIMMCKQNTWNVTHCHCKFYVQYTMCKPYVQYNIWAICSLLVSNVFVFYHPFSISKAAHNKEIEWLIANFWTIPLTSSTILILLSLINTNQNQSSDDIFLQFLSNMNILSHNTGYSSQHDCATVISVVFISEFWCWCANWIV